MGVLNANLVVYLQSLSSLKTIYLSFSSELANGPNKLECYITIGLLGKGQTL
jgi:hypothetical protein